MRLQSQSATAIFWKSYMFHVPCDQEALRSESYGENTDIHEIGEETMGRDMKKALIKINYEWGAGNAQLRSQAASWKDKLTWSCLSI